MHLSCSVSLAILDISLRTFVFLRRGVRLEMDGVVLGDTPIYWIVWVGKGFADHTSDEFAIASEVLSSRMQDGDQENPRNTRVMPERSSGRSLTKLNPKMQRIDK